MVLLQVVLRQMLLQQMLFQQMLPQQLLLQQVLLQQELLLRRALRQVLLQLRLLRQEQEQGGRARRLCDGGGERRPRPTAVAAVQDTWLMDPLSAPQETVRAQPAQRAQCCCGREAAAAPVAARTGSNGGCDSGGECQRLTDTAVVFARAEAPSSGCEDGRATAACALPSTRLDSCTPPLRGAGPHPLPPPASACAGAPAYQCECDVSMELPFARCYGPCSWGSWTDSPCTRMCRIARLHRGPCDCLQHPPPPGYGVGTRSTKSRAGPCAGEPVATGTAAPHQKQSSETAAQHCRAMRPATTAKNSEVP